MRHDSRPLPRSGRREPLPQPKAPFDRAQLPSAEPARQRHLIHLMALVALAASFAYLSWRVAFTLGPDLWLAVPLWLLELHAVFSLGLFTFSLWELDSVPPPAAVSHTDLRVAVLIPTYNEEREVLLPTIAAAVSLEPAHRTVVLDDGERPWVRHLAAELGAEYLARPEHTHAKAGNLNYAIARIEADVVGVLDADHVATSDFLTHTLGYFADPKIAVVQTPQDFYNVDSFEHTRSRSWFWRRRRAGGFNEQRLFYRALEPGKNRWGAAFWCGTSALVRVAALRDVGGVAYETLTEDIHTTVRMHRRGWRTAFHNEVLAYGLAARDAEQYQTQRSRWGIGAMQLLRLERPLTGRGLTLAQRTAYASTLLGWFDSWRTLGYVLLPLLVLASGAAPLVASFSTFAVVFGGVFVVQRVALSSLGRGYAPQGVATLFDFIRMQTNLQATLTLLRSRDQPFEVTAKGGYAARRRVTAPVLLWTLFALTAAAAIWFAAGLAGLTPVSYDVRWVAYGAAGWAGVNALFLVSAIYRIQSDRFAADRRRGVRMRIGAGRVRLDDADAELLDISVGGALVRCAEPPVAVDGSLRLRFSVGNERIMMSAQERSRLPVGASGALIGVEFSAGQDRTAARFVVALFSRRHAIEQGSLVHYAA
jgi:cellulose synthase/poly-beta-1,6-N-acetylglucosamine synthase-like glycosyltransferase